ncbi:response regulator transcription factor [Streptomyces sp. SS8]
MASGCPSADALRRDMQRHGFDAFVAPSGGDVLEAYHDCDLILLDTGLPDLDGVSVCQAIRGDSEVPIIGFTPAGAEVDRVLLLEAGCDDCVEIPYRARELVARIKAILRRTGTSRVPEETGRGEGDRLELGPLVIDPSRREACLYGRPLALTRKEFDLLYTLATEPDRIFQRQELMSVVWDYPADTRVSVQASRTIDTHVSSLRGKLGSSEWITTIRGVGFRFGVPASEADVPGPGRARPGPEPVGEAVELRPKLLRMRSANGSARHGLW